MSKFINLYVLSRIYRILHIKILQKSAHKFPGIYDYSFSTDLPKTIGFDFSNPKYNHIGDQLFFEPLLENFRRLGFSVYVAPTKAMCDYFKSAGYEIVSPSDILKCELRIASIWMQGDIERNERYRNFIYLNTAAHGMAKPVTDHLLGSIFQLLGLPYEDAVGKARPFRISPNCEFLSDLPVIVYNDSIDSGRFRLTKDHYRRLEEQGKLMESKGFKILRLGTEQDKISRPEFLPFPHVDYRGMTNVIDIFNIIGSPNISGTISFDTAIAHISLLYNKPAWICLRRFSKLHQLHIIKNIFPSYSTKVKSDVFYI